MVGNDLHRLTALGNTRGTAVDRTSHPLPLRKRTSLLWGIVCRAILPWFIGSGVLYAQGDASNQAKDEKRNTEIVAVEEDDELARLPGLIGRYTSPTANFTSIDDHAGFKLSEGQTVDVRLPVRGWNAVWEGVIEVRSPGKYRFSAQGSGPIDISVAGNPVLNLGNATRQPALGKEVNLEFGLLPIVVRFHQTGPVPLLKIFWEGEGFSREPVSPRVLGHRRERHPPVDSFMQGWKNFEEHSCLVCHAALPGSKLATQIATRPGPNLSDAGSRLKTGWIYHWLGNPQEFRPEAVMPQMFANDKKGDIERLSVAVFLASRVTSNRYPPRKLSPEQTRQFAEDGKRLFEQTGCVVCHEKQGAMPARATLQFLGKKTSPEFLAEFIQNPAIVDPAGRMPGFKLQPDDATFRLATFLIERDSKIGPAFELPPLPQLADLREALVGRKPTAAEILDLAVFSPEELLVKLGRRVMQTKRCTNCHEFQIPGETQEWKPRLSEATFDKIAGANRTGCLTIERSGNTTIPVFGASLDQSSVREFLNQARAVPGESSPRQLAQLTLQRLNCLGCHERNGDGGLAPDLLAKWIVNQTEENAESVGPPSLTGVVDRLNATYLQQVLDHGRRSRPWMSLKMPQFATQNLKTLPAAIAAIDGDDLQLESVRLEPNQELIQAGRTLVGDKGFGCIKCHDMLGVPGLGTRGPELSQVVERVNLDWYHRWMADPQRLQPGTRMPTYFPNGKSSLDGVLKGDIQLQKTAIWQYLIASKSLPYPDGLKSKTPEILASSSRPQLLRTFLPGTTPRGIAIQFPNAIHVAFDAQTCNVAYGWSGEFLDLSPVWTGRGGQRAGVKGAIFWTAPTGFPWEVTTSPGAIPEFGERGKQTEYGAELPHDGQLHPSRVHFKGYSTRGDSPTFRYQLDINEQLVAEFAESVKSLKSELGYGVERRVQVIGPKDQFVWFHTARFDEPPEWSLSASDRGILASEVTGSAVIFGKQDGKLVIVSIKNPPSGSQWMVAKQFGKFALVLRVPLQGGPAANQIQLQVWNPIEGDGKTFERLFLQLQTK